MKTVEESEIAQTEMNTKYQVVEEQLEKLSSELKGIKEKNNDLSLIIVKQKELETSKIFYDDIKGKLCKKCDQKLTK